MLNAGFSTFGNELIAILYLTQVIFAMLSPAVISKLGIKKSLVFSAALMSTFAFSLIIIGWRTTLSADKITEYRAAEVGLGPASVGSFFYKKETCRVILILGNFLTGVG